MSLSVFQQRYKKYAWMPFALIAVILLFAQVRRPGLLLFLWLCAAAVFNVGAQIVAARRDKEALEELRTVLPAIQESHALLVAWAEEWPDSRVRQRLMAILKRVKD